MRGEQGFWSKVCLGVGVKGECSEFQGVRFRSLGSGVQIYPEALGALVSSSSCAAECHEFSAGDPNFLITCSIVS